MSATDGPGRFAVVGHPVAHSLSPTLMRAAFDALGIDARYEAIDLAPDRIESELERLRAAGYRGLNVTAPFKADAYRIASEHTEEAARSGAANCLRLDAGSFTATNTDGTGFVSFLAESGHALPGTGAVLLGAGGAARGLAPALREAGARVTIVARRVERFHDDVAFAGCETVEWDGFAADEAIATATLVVNGTPLGARPGDALPCEPDRIAPGTVCVDLRYTGDAERWLEAVRSRASAAVDGLGLLVHQAAHSLAFWLDVEPPWQRLRESVSWHPIRLTGSEGGGGS